MFSTPGLFYVTFTRRLYIYAYTLYYVRPSVQTKARRISHSPFPSFFYTGVPSSYLAPGLEDTNIYTSNLVEEKPFLSHNVTRQYSR